MINKVIDFCIEKRILIILMFFLVLGYGIKNISETPVDALPDLSDIQVIIKTDYNGQSPDIIEEQITNPLSKGLLSVPNSKVVRGFSYFGVSYVYVIFEEDIDLYWARSRVLEYLQQIKSQLPADVEPELGSDASGVGWIFQYALISENSDLGELKSLQDWYLKQELQSVKGVAEVATVGGFEKNYQVIIDPKKLMSYKIDLKDVISAIQMNNSEISGSVVEMAEAEYMIRSKGFLKSISDIENVPLNLSNNPIPLFLKDVATIREGSGIRRGIAEFNGEGEVVGGIVIMRYDENALKTIERVKEKLNTLKQSLPQGVKIQTVYDRSELINNSISNLKDKIVEELIIVSLICFVFLLHVRSTLVAIIVVPLSILTAFIIMRYLGVNANIMSLGGIAIAIGAVIDGSIVMIENMHKHLEKFNLENNRAPSEKERWNLVSVASKEVGGGIFASLMIIIISFLPVFALEAQEGKLFAPLAYTKTLTMLSALIISVTLIPVLMGYLIRGDIKREDKNIVNRVLIKVYSIIIKLSLRNPKKVILLFFVIGLTAYYPYSKLGTEFMPELEEGDLLYMPSAFSSLSVGKAKELLQQTNKLIKTVPEVDTVFGKIGRAETSTDPAPLTMIETTIQLKDKIEWREGVTIKSIIEELDNKVQIPSLSNAWVQPIKTRIDMLSTGIKTDIGIKIKGDNPKILEKIGSDIEEILKDYKNTKYIFSEKTGSGRYIDIKPNPISLSKYNIELEDFQIIIKNAIGGAKVTTSIQGDERYDIIVRYPQSLRDDIDKIKELPVLTKNFNYIPLRVLADISIKDNPSMFKSEDGELTSWIFITPSNNIKEYIKESERLLKTKLDLPSQYSYSFAGQYEYIERVEEKLSFIIPFTIIGIFIVLMMQFNSLKTSLLIMLTLPFSIVGSIWFIYLLDYNLSVAVVIGIIALMGVAVEFGVIMQIYLNNALSSKNIKSEQDIDDALIEGSVLRIRPKAMTVLTLFLGLLPIMFGVGSGNEIMQKIAAPMIGGMITAPLLSLILIPVIFKLIKKNELKNNLK
jgi:Cu(I)/Ag(I) efflux system membrane protein CusA/SilA